MLFYVSNSLLPVAIDFPAISPKASVPNVHPPQQMANRCLNKPPAVPFYALYASFDLSSPPPRCAAGATKHMDASLPGAIHTPHGLTMEKWRAGRGCSQKPPLKPDPPPPHGDRFSARWHSGLLMPQHLWLKWPEMWIDHRRLLGWGRLPKLDQPQSSPHPPLGGTANPKPKPGPPQAAQRGPAGRRGWGATPGAADQPQALVE